MQPSARRPRESGSIQAAWVLKPALLLALLPLASSTARGRKASAPAALDADQLSRTLRGCHSKKGFGFLVSPRVPVQNRPLRVLVVAEREEAGAVLVRVGPEGTASLAAQRGGGPPYWWLARVERPAAGTYRFALMSRDGAPLACATRRVEPRPPKALPSGTEQWPVVAAWSRYAENLYSAWIEKLFEAPLGTQPSWTPLHQVIRDPSRNILYDHLGSAEDGPDGGAAVVVQPDCADLPYFLRAYFSWKMGLPFGYRHCDRGSSTRPTRCEPVPRTNLSVPAEAGRGGSPAARFSRFLRHHVSLVHSGSGRTGPDDDETDLYPVALSRKSLRPGTVYVDPYGHLLVVARWVSQTAEHGGLLYAVDGHPDLSVGRKRFWRGAFLFSDQIQGGAGGFKAFRPLVRRRGQVAALSNAEIRASLDYGNFSSEQYELGIDGFYDRMDRVINPQPLSPLMAYRERLEALHELITERVGSVQVGEEYVKKTRGAEISMPRGPKIFETKDAWEDYSTPARDIRLLIAIEEVRRFPEKVVRQPKLFAFPAGREPAAVRRELEALYEASTREKGLTYTRSDGTPWKLTMADVIARRRGLEVAYNPNDCVEIRWAAQGEELSPCRRHAPEAQRRLMEKYRIWFATRTRPPLR